MSKSPALFAVLAACLAVTAPAWAATLAGAPEPVKTVDIQRLQGRWYEIARIPNRFEKDCGFATTDWVPQSGGRFLVTQTCKKTEVDRDGHVTRATADPLDPAGNAKWRMNYFGGLIRRDYWLVDHAADGSWVLMGMPRRPSLWLFGRQQSLTPVQREQALQRARALGYDPALLVFPSSLPGEYIGPPPVERAER